MAVTLFDRCGGFATVSRIVMDFYGRILDSEKAGDFFDGVDMARLIDHQTKFIASLMGGPASYTDDHLRRTHAALGVDGESFDEMVGILCDTLRAHGLEGDDVSSIRRTLEAKRFLIVTV